MKEAVLRGNQEMDVASVTWDYSALARPYLKRPNYSEAGLDAMLAIAKVTNNSAVCDVGAGIGHLTIPLSQRHLTVTAVEPNDEMRKLGAERTRRFRYSDQLLTLDRTRQSWRTRRVNQKTGFSGSISTAG